MNIIIHSGTLVVCPSQPKGHNKHTKDQERSPGSMLYQYKNDTKNDITSNYVLSIL